MFQLHDIVKDTVGDKIKTDYKRDGDDVFSFSIDLLNYAVGSWLDAFHSRDLDSSVRATDS